jgi:hypothetical protein
MLVAAENEACYEDVYMRASTFYTINRRTIPDFALILDISGPTADHSSVDRVR